MILFRYAHGHFEITGWGLLMAYALVGTIGSWFRRGR